MSKNRFGDAANKPRVAPGGEQKPVVTEKEKVVVESPKPTAERDVAKENPLAGMIEPKPEGKSYGFYLSVEANNKLEELARKNKCSKSKALDALLRSLS